jgi:hypothetical protein
MRSLEFKHFFRPFESLSRHHPIRVADTPRAFAILVDALRFRG